MEKINIYPTYVIRTTVAYAKGNWVRFTGSQERLFLGDHNFKVDDEVEIRIRHAPPKIYGATDQVGPG